MVSNAIRDVTTYLTPLYPPTPGGSVWVVREVRTDFPDFPSWQTILDFGHLYFSLIYTDLKTFQCPEIFHIRMDCAYCILDFKRDLAMRMLTWPWESWRNWSKWKSRRHFQLLFSKDGSMNIFVERQVLNKGLRAPHLSNSATGRLHQSTCSAHSNNTSTSRAYQSTCCVQRRAGTKTIRSATNKS